MPRIVLDFNLSNQKEAAVYQYLSDYANGKKAIVVQSILHTMKMNADDTSPVVAPIPVMAVENKTSKEKKKKETLAVTPKEEPVIAPEPVFDTPASSVPTSAPVSAPAAPTSTMPPLGGGLGGLGGAPGFKLNVTKDKDPRLAFLSDTDYDTIMDKFDIDEMTEEFLREFQRIYEDNEGYPGNIGMKMNRAMAETYVTLTMKS